VVIRFGLCPFAEGVVTAGAVRCATTAATRGSQVFRTVLEEAATLLRAPEDEVATTLLVAPRFLTDDFPAFYEFCTWLESILEADEVR
ncbi:unnamed protein product, partial [Phaeothamnion confervicola]